MSFVAPWMVAAGIAAAIAVLALHLLSVRRPPMALLPTARFVPASDVRAVARTTTPTDLLLLALRVLAALLIGLGFAQPLPNAPGPLLRSVVALEWTTALEDVDAARRSALEQLGSGDALVIFDTAARIVDPTELGALPAPTVRRASLSPMYIAAQDAARTIARGADSLRLLVLSAHSADAADAATAVLRGAWPGRVDRVGLRAAVDSAEAPPVQLQPADATDPLAPALRALPLARGGHPVRVQRDALTTADSTWLGENRGAVLLLWPRQFADTSVRADGVALLDGAGASLVTPLARLTPTGAKRAGSPYVSNPPTEGRVLARWRDGTAAVTERSVGEGCLREVGIGIPESGDLTLRIPFSDFLSGLVSPCGGRREVPLSHAALTTASDAGPLASAAAFVADGAERSPLTPWLLGAAVLLLLVEQILRQRQRAEAA